MCRDLETECVFDYTQDQRRKIAGHRRDEDFKSQTRMMEGLFEVVRSGEESSVQELLALIRAEAPMAQIAAKVEDNLEGSQPGQKRKWSVSDTESPAKGTALTSQHSFHSTSPIEGTSPYPVLDNPNLAVLNRDYWHPSLQLPLAQDQDLDTDQRQGIGSQSNSSRHDGQVRLLSTSFQGRV